MIPPWARPGWGFRSPARPLFIDGAKRAERQAAEQSAEPLESGSALVKQTASISPTQTRGGTEPITYYRPEASGGDSCRHRDPETY
jgi:hypothetical protein